MNRKWILVFRSMSAAFFNSVPFLSKCSTFSCCSMFFFLIFLKKELAKKTFNSFLCTLQGCCADNSENKLIPKKNSIFCNDL